MSSTEQNASVSAPVEAVATKTAAKKVVRPVAKKITPPVARRAAPTAAKWPTQAVPKALVPPTPVAEAGETKSDKRLKPKKAKKVHEDFSLPMLEYLMLETLKLRSSKLGSPVKKNVLVRAGIMALAAMSDASFLTALKTVPAAKVSSASQNQ